MAGVNDFKSPLLVYADEIAGGWDHYLIGRTNLNLFAVNSQKDRPLGPGQLTP
jgi:allophanate hydrolase subunit 1